MLRSYYTTEQVAEKLNVSSDEVRKWIRQGRLVAVNIGEGSRRVYRIPEAEIVRFAEQRSTAGAA